MELKSELKKDLIDLGFSVLDLGADSLRYLRVDALAECIGLPEKDLCMGCLTGKYPTEWGNKLYREATLTREEAAPEGVVPEGRRTHERQRSAVTDGAVSPSAAETQGASESTFSGLPAPDSSKSAGWREILSRWFPERWLRWRWLPWSS